MAVKIVLPCSNIDTISFSDCGEAVTPVNGKINFENLTHVEVECNRGFVLVGDYLLECLGSGNWEVSPTCAIGELYRL